MKVTQLCPTLCNPMDYIVHGILQTRILEWVPSPGDLPNPGIEPRSPALWADSLPAEPQGKPMILEWVAIPSPRDPPDLGIEPGSPALQVDSLPTELSGKPKLLEWVAYPFSSGSSQPRKSNWGLLHCRQILYQLCYEGYALPDVDCILMCPFCFLGSY